jgi:hypothetical protein
MARRRPLTKEDEAQLFPSIDGTDKEFFSLLFDEIDEKYSKAAQTALTLILASNLEHSLMKLLDSFFVIIKCGECKECKKGQRCKKNDTIFAQKETLESFSKCADLAFRLGLITPTTRANLSRIGSVRNRFAHHPCAIGFDDPEVKKDCRNLVIPRTHETCSSDEISDDPKSQNAIDAAKSRYIDAALWVGCCISGAQISLKRCVPIWSQSQWEFSGD